MDCQVSRRCAPSSTLRRTCIWPIRRVHWPVSNLVVGGMYPRLQDLELMIDECSGYRYPVRQCYHIYHEAILRELYSCCPTMQCVNVETACLQCLVYYYTKQTILLGLDIPICWRLVELGNKLRCSNDVTAAIGRSSSMPPCRFRLIWHRKDSQDSEFRRLPTDRHSGSVLGHIFCALLLHLAGSSLRTRALC